MPSTSEAWAGECFQRGAGVISGWLRGAAAHQQHQWVCARVVAMEENEQPCSGLMKKIQPLRAKPTLL